jgi:hypothetical protein
MRKVLAMMLSIAVCGMAAAQRGNQGNQQQQQQLMLQALVIFNQLQNDPVLLIARPDVQKEIALSDEQLSKLGDVRKGAVVKFMGASSANTGQMDVTTFMEQVRKMRADVSKQVFDLLKPDQGKRLKELSVQRAGINAIFLPDTQQDLGLNDIQRAGLTKLQKGLQTANSAIDTKKASGELSEDEAKLAHAKNDNILQQEVAKILKPAQRTKLKGLAGKPFTFDATPSAFPSFGPPR